MLDMNQKITSNISTIGIWCTAVLIDSLYFIYLFVNILLLFNSSAYLKKKFKFSQKYYYTGKNAAYVGFFLVLSFENIHWKVPYYHQKTDHNLSCLNFIQGMQRVNPRFIILIIKGAIDHSCLKQKIAVDQNQKYLHILSF